MTRYATVSSKALAKPGGNITGITTFNQELAGKQLELLKDTIPKVSRISSLWNQENRTDLHTVKELQSASRWFGVQIQPQEIRGTNDFDEAFRLIVMNRADALFVISSPIINLHRLKVIDFAAKNKLPGIYPDRRWVEDGGLMAYASDLLDLARRAATYVDKILKGADPADLPVEQPAKFELVINLKTAKQIGLTIPPQVLARADRVIK
jgi:putative ABC transport system substrate-binding protein